MSDGPALDCAYKLQENDGLPRRKLSTDKATWPGRKQVWRRYGPDGRMAGDTLSVEDDVQPGEPLIQPVMQNGRRTKPRFADVRAHAAREFEQLPQPLRRLEPGASYPVEVAAPLVRLSKAVDDRLQRRPGSGVSAGANRRADSPRKG